MPLIQRIHMQTAVSLPLLAILLTTSVDGQYPTPDMGVPQLVTILQTGKRPGDRAAAAGQLASLGPEATEAVPAMLRALRDEKESFVRAEIVRSLGRIDPAAEGLVEAIVPLLADHTGDPPQRGEVAAAAIETLKKVGAPAVPDVVEMLAMRRPHNDDDAEIAGSASSALVAIGQAAIPATIEALRDPRKRFFALMALGGLGERWPKEVVPSVLRYATDSDPYARQEVTRALERAGRAGGAAAEVSPTLIRMLDDCSENVRTSATQALVSMGPEAAPAVPRLTRELDKSLTSDHRRAIMYVFARLGPKAAAALPRLERLWEEGQRDYDIEMAIRAIRGAE
jgi:HEAT repeat protein